MKKIGNFQSIKPTKGKNLPIKIKKNLFLFDNEFPLNISRNLSFIRKLVSLPFIGNFFLSERNQEFLVVDYLIFGENFALNIILLKKILEKAIANNKTTTVGIVSQSEFDYWGYHYYKKNEIAFNTLMNEIVNLEHPFLKIIKIGDNFDVGYYRQNSNNLGRYSFFLKEKKLVISSIEMAMPSLADAQRKLKQSLLWEVNSVFRKLDNFQLLMFSKPQNDKLNQIICNNVFFTSYQPWLNHKVNVTSYLLKVNDVDNIMAEATLFNHDLFSDHSFGSAYHIPNSFEYLESFVEIDLLFTQKFII